MELEVHQVLLWLCQVNSWLYIIYTLHRVIKTHQNQSANIPKLQIFSETPTPYQL